MAWRCDCGEALGRVALIAALDAVPVDRMGSAGMLSLPCPKCGRTMEARVRAGGFDVGFSYSSGSLHFEPLERISVHGLRVERPSPDTMEVTVGDRIWRFAGVR